MNIHPLPPRFAARAILISGVSLPEAWFDEAELLEASRFVRAARRDEWLSSRVAAKELARLRGLVSDPRRCRVERPHLLVDDRPVAFVSLSHARGYAAAAIDERPIGIDVEVVREIRESGAHLFLTDDEEAAMQRCTIDDRLIHFWAAKEAVWKEGGGTVPTLRRVPLTVVREERNSIVFDRASTWRSGQTIVALTVAPA